MCPYFYELDKKDQFMTYYQNDELPKQVPLFQYPIGSISIDQLSELKQVLKILPMIDLLITELTRLWIPEEKQEVYAEFLNFKADNEPVALYVQRKIDITNNDLLDLLEIYSRYVSFLMYFFKEENLKTISKLLKSTIKWVEGMCWIEIPVQKNKPQLWPDNWYITPNGYLYNACQNGKKTGGLFWTFQSILDISKTENAKELLEQKIESLKKHIASLEARDYVTFFEYEPYMDYTPFPFSNMQEDLGCSYQKNIKLLVLGHLNAELCLYEQYLNLYEKNKGCIRSLLPGIDQTEEDVLVGICAFHRVEPTEEKIITTSSENAFEQLFNYQQNGWTIRVISPITVGPPKVYQKE